MWLYSLPGLGDLHEIYIFSHFLHSSCPNFYRNVLKIQKCVTCNQARSIFGFKGEDNIGWATVYYSNIILDWVSVCIHCIFFDWDFYSSETWYILSRSIPPSKNGLGNLAYEWCVSRWMGNVQLRGCTVKFFTLNECYIFYFNSNSNFGKTLQERPQTSVYLNILYISQTSP